MSNFFKKVEHIFCLKFAHTAKETYFLLLFYLENSSSYHFYVTSFSKVGTIESPLGSPRHGAGVQTLLLQITLLPSTEVLSSALSQF